MKKIICAFLLYSICGCTTDNNLKPEIRKPSQADSEGQRIRAIEMTAIVIKQGAKTAQRQFIVGDTVTIKASAKDPNGLPLEYKFSIAHNSGWTDLTNYVRSNEFTYTFVPQDALALDVAFSVQVKNNDGQVDHLGADASSYIHGIVVSDGIDRQPTKLKNFKLLVNGSESTQKSFKVGDVIQLVASATDPKKLPFTYTFSIARNSGWSDLNEPSKNNSLSYTFTQKDALAETIAFGVSVVNNDGKSNHLGEDDAKNIHDITVSDGVQYMPTKLSSFKLLVNGSESNQKSFKVGDKIELVAVAIDPKKLPFTYTFSIARNSGWSDLNEPSKNNSLSYTFTQKDVLVQSIAFGVSVVNNDGKSNHLGEDDAKYIHDIKVSDGVERTQPIITDQHLEVEVDRFLTKKDAALLLNKLRGDTVMARKCGVIMRRVGTFLADETRSSEQVLALFGQDQIADNSSKECITYISKILPTLPDLGREVKANAVEEPKNNNWFNWARWSFWK